jgi:ribonuclease HI
MSHHIVYCDGACIGNPGPAGWGAVVIAPDGEQTELAGSLGHATNQVAELSAAIGALESIPAGSQVRLHSDSQYLIKGVKEWMQGWKRRGWRTANGSPVANLGLWQRLDELRRVHHIEPIWVKGHAGHPLNERADRLANKAARGLVTS